MAICLLRSVTHNPKCLATREGDQCRGQRHRLIPQGLGNALAGLGAGLTPMRKLPCYVVELVFGV